MSAERIYRALGLMSGATAGGIDAAIIETDGDAHVAFGPACAFPYADDTSRQLREAMIAAQRWPKGVPTPKPIRQAAEAVTRAHADAVEMLLRAADLPASAIDVVGFHGQTVLHRPSERRSVQLGDGAVLASRVGIDVVCDFRTRDLAAGGQGTPLVPLYHAALAAELTLPLVIVNIGGVSNISYVGPEGELLAFDAGPGNGPLEDWALRHLGTPTDEGGALAGAGRVDNILLSQWLSKPFFARRPPKSVDRFDFDVNGLSRLNAADGAATLAAFTANAIRAGFEHLPAWPRRVLVTGGGRQNPAVMAALGKALGFKAEPAEAVGWRGDMIEAEAFAYLAVRSLQGRPLSVPSTTGVPAPLTGGVLFRAPRCAAEQPQA